MSQSEENNDYPVEEVRVELADPDIHSNLYDVSLHIPEILPILPLRNMVVYPQTVLPLSADQPRAIRLIESAFNTNRLIVLAAMTNPEVDVPKPEDVYHVATVAMVHRLLRALDGSVRLIIQGLKRLRIVGWTATEPYLQAKVELYPEVISPNVELEALQRNLLDLFSRQVDLVTYLPDELIMAANSTNDPRQLAYLIATSIRMELKEAQQILEVTDVSEKLHLLTRILNRELEVLELGQKIQSEAQGEMERTQREYYLREQLKAIQKELGNSDNIEQVDDYRIRIMERGMSEEGRKQALRELNRMEKMPPQAAEYGIIKSYLDWLLEIPWNEMSEDNLDIKHARKVLDHDHYDLDEVKERIIEYLAVRQLAHERYPTLNDSNKKPADSDAFKSEPEEEVATPNTGAILCLVGPPGVGKTSLGRSIARALGRKFSRMSLGGLRDEAELRGHRRTYIGAMPGRLMQALKREGTRNPLFVLDEIDKLGRDFRGDPTSVLLEILDPQQNNTFRDYYLDVDFDLSAIMFVATANELGPIPAPLRDRMEIIHIDGYTEKEKLFIAHGYLIPRQLIANALRENEVSFTDEALRRIIHDYTREAGVRNLEREIGSVMRKVAIKVAQGEMNGTMVITEELVPQFLGKRKFYSEASDRTEIPGVATALAATATGGDILFIEATGIAGGKGLTLTGQLGDVMQESARIAYSYVRSKALLLHIKPSYFNENEIHLHVPAGATPKDGPSAGITMVTALVSLLTRRPVHANVGMTGEITLRGRVLPVGGIKQKVLAAHRSELNTIILPKRNEKDLDDLPPEVREEMKFILVEEIGQVFKAALSKPLDPASYNADLLETFEQQAE